MKRLNILFPFIVVSIVLCLYGCYGSVDGECTYGIKMAVNNPSPNYEKGEISIRIGYQDTTTRTLYYDAWMTDIRATQAEDTLVYWFNETDEASRLSGKIKKTPQGKETTDYPYDQDHEFSKYPYSLNENGFFVVERIDSARTRVKLAENTTGEERKIYFRMQLANCFGGLTLIQEAKP